MRECPSDRQWCRNSDVKPITDQWTDPLTHTASSLLPRPKRVELSPCGDRAVVIAQDDYDRLSLLVYLRLSPRGGFVLTSRTPVVQHPEKAVGLNGLNGPPDGDRLRSVPLVAAFSPCGRFLLLLGFRGIEQHDGHGVYQRRRAGMCVVDVGKDAPQLAWIDCRRDLLPRAVRWNSAGLWLGVEGQGLLLLGM